MGREKSGGKQGVEEECEAFNRFDPDTLAKRPENMSLEEKTAESTYDTTKKVLNRFQNIDYPASVADQLEVDQTTVRYHVEKLQYLGLLKLYSRRSDRTLYKITNEGEVVLDNLNI